MAHPSTSLTLIERAQAGDERAWHDLRRLYLKLMYFWCRNAHGLNETDSHEICANVVDRIVEGLPGFRHSGRTGAFRAWLKVITRHEISDFYKDKKNEVPIGDILPDAVIETESFLADEKIIKYHEAWAIIRSEFSNRDQQIFQRVVENSEQPKNVASDMQLSRDVVNTVVYRIKNVLRTRFSGEADL